MSDQETLRKFEIVWGSIDDLCAPLSEEEWHRPTDLPGWSVKDNLSHIIGTESYLLDRPAPEHTPADVSHVHNPIGHMNEVNVDYRRPRSGAEVLAEFREVTAARLDTLRGFTGDDWERETSGPVGPTSYREFMQIRIFDCWVHEQDMRRALGQPGHWDGPVAEHSLGRMVMAMPFVVGKKAAAPDGATVAFVIDAGPQFAVGVEGRARVLDAVPENPTARIAAAAEAFLTVGCGRRPPQEAVAAGDVSFSGDEALARTVWDSLNFMM